MRNDMKLGRRQWLGWSAAMLALQMAWLRDALAGGSVEKGAHLVRGDVRVNGTPAKEGMDVKAGDVVTTGAGSETVFVTSKEAFLIRANSRVEVQVHSARSP